MRSVLLIVLFCLAASAVAQSRPLTIAAASDLRYAMQALQAEYARQHPGDDVRVIFGSSGKFSTQIENGAPFDLFFSADESFPQRLHARGFAATAPRHYGLGRLVLWIQSDAAEAPALADLAAPRFARIAIANPQHAPYGMRAEEALRGAGLWDTVQPRLVMGENISQAAQMVHSGAADIGIVALALMFGDDLRGRGRYTLVDDALHTPLWQAFIVTRRAAGDPRAARFADFVLSEAGRAILASYGFVLPEGE
jgi:molybdate transport system substrate-binding protein